MGINQVDNESWDMIYGTNESSRYVNEGDIGIYYRLPKYVELFQTRFPDLNNLKILEIGCGLGEVYDLVEKKYLNQSFSYTLTEYSPNAVSILKNRYPKNVVCQADATNLPFVSADEVGVGYDIVCAFDVMHHVSDPKKMAKEILRVTKRYFFLCEPNGVSVIQRIGQLLPQSKKNGEKSYFPWEYKKFFIQNGAKNVKMIPFYFFIPPKIKRENMKPFIKISEFGQKVPLLRWQSQTLAIFGDKN